MVSAVQVNKIIPMSLVDGPGNRTAIFLQGCNIACRYCHNPETQNLCVACGRCVSVCPSGALSLVDAPASSLSTRAIVKWDPELCTGCDSCIAACENSASPKVRMMTPSQVMDEVRKNMPFIRGISVSGGECTLHPEWLESLFTLARAEGLTTLIDSNGTVDFSLHPSLMKVCDGVMLDVKAWDTVLFGSLTASAPGSYDRIVKKNLAFLASQGKIQELRIVCVPGLVDVEAVLEGIVNTLSSIPCSDAKAESIRIKLIRFRNNGVRGPLSSAPSPSLSLMESYKSCALSLGLLNTIII